MKLILNRLPEVETHSHPGVLRPGVLTFGSEGAIFNANSETHRRSHEDGRPEKAGPAQHRFWDEHDAAAGAPGVSQAPEHSPPCKRAPIVSVLCQTFCSLYGA